MIDRRPSASPRSGGSSCSEAGIRAALPARPDRRCGGERPPARRSAARLDLDGRPGPPPDAPPAASAPTSRTELQTPARRWPKNLRVLGPAASTPPPHETCRRSRAATMESGKHLEASTTERCATAPTSSSRCWNGTRAEGPLASRDFEGAGVRHRHVEPDTGEDGARGALGPGRPRGRRRAVFQRRYDLAERVIPRAPRRAHAGRGRDSAHSRSLPCVPAER